MYIYAYIGLTDFGRVEYIVIFQVPINWLSQWVYVTKNAELLIKNFGRMVGQKLLNEIISLISWWRILPLILDGKNTFPLTV